MHKRLKFFGCTTGPLKKYWSTEHEDKTHVSHAMVFEPEEGDEDELSLFTSAQTETYKDVKVNPELTEEQRGEMMKVFEEFQDVFTDVPGLNKFGKTFHHFNYRGTDS